MPRMLVRVALVWVVVLASSTRADYLVVSRDATLKGAPERDAEVLSPLKSGTLLTLLQSDQRSGYYSARFSDSNQQGWVYRTFVRRYRGIAPTRTATRANSATPAIPIHGGTVEPPAAASDASTSAVMYAHFIDVGQANATLLEFECGAILIEAGAVDDDGSETLVHYLERFFVRRVDLDRTLESIIITHNHIDHTRALRDVVENFTVKRYVDNGQADGSVGTGNPRWVRTNAEERAITVREVLDPEVRDLHHRRGLTDEDIDPIDCPACDPKIVVLSGQLMENPGFTDREFENKNNHSIVIRVDFGEASFLFTGDLEKPGIERLLTYYHGESILDSDVYHVGHHGSYNATTDELLQAVTPEIAMISCGKWTDGRNEPENQFTTWKYGHPRDVTIDRINAILTRSRSEPKSVRVFSAPATPHRVTIRKAVYATGWDGTVKIRADSQGRFVTTTAP